MTKILIALGVFLIGWGGYVLFTGDYVATLDIAASLVASGAGVIALAAVVRSLDTIAGRLAPRDAEGALPAYVPAEPDEPLDRPAMFGHQAPDNHADVAAEEAAPSADLDPVEETVQPVLQPAGPEPTGPALVREGVIEGRHYRFYSDGSIEAEGPRGVRRYQSIDEAREQILRDREPPEPAPPAVVVEAPETLSVPRRPIEPARRPAISARAAKASDSVTWDSYLSAGSTGADQSPPPFEIPEASQGTAEDDEWSEPFRMLLKGDGSDTAPGAPKPRKR